MATYGRFPLTLVRGKGCWVRDERGRRYLDAVAGIATCTLGHSDPALRRALADQLRKLQHVSNLYRIQEQEDLAHWLVDHSCADSVFFCNSGAEANEAAIKLARKHGHTVRGIEAPVILTAKASFHGRTLAAVSATGQPKYHQGFEPMVAGFDTFPYNDLDGFETTLKRWEAEGPRVAAVLIEPLQGEGGVNPGDRAFFQAVRQHCSQRGILLILDEVQTGMGRTGQLWGYEHLGIEPDAFTLAKGLGGGHAIGALLVQSHADHFAPGDHASTFGGNPFACRAGLTVARELQRRRLLRHVNARAEQLRQGLESLIQRHPDRLEAVRGWGLLQGLVLRDDWDVSAVDVVRAALDQGLLLVAAGARVVRMVPPLVISRREVTLLLQRLDASLASLPARATQA
ncbi:acetylornithine/N-succinyldiaminopimelate aminotransferase [Synechococcus sp. RS9909]|uniref:aspartate aminotransferase family protein n=1 Tax=unclassified Synechococcus TaxID=2626047 RepID=UPI000068FC55|nr:MULTISPECIES: aspartate aminotransferase family protein [unclassified Synechococcus]EAQ68077.1 Acetylornithine and succinylornithine aminotransferase [Synechococcus sp. RS9917]QNI78762.1 acetylornithine/N-succinyldiaminopimelate aminotransferase [Synechococcus sp. RS9909]